MKKLENGTKLFDCLPREILNNVLFPFNYHLFEAEKFDITDEIEELIQGEDCDFYKSYKMQCFSFYKPISRII